MKIKIKEKATFEGRVQTTKLMKDEISTFKDMASNLSDYSEKLLRIADVGVWSLSDIHSFLYITDDLEKTVKYLNSKIKEWQL